jgi:uncharacterized protein YkwD
MLRALRAGRRFVTASVLAFVLAFVLVMSAASIQPSAGLMAAADADAAADESAEAAGEPAQHANLKPAAATSPNIPQNYFDTEAEHTLLELANQARAQAGAPRLALDAGMSKAARTHAEAMFAGRQLSHQFDGEPSLPQRLAAASRTQLDQEGENVATDFDAERGHQHLMLSPPHRANLLNPAYTVVGLGVVRSGDRLYIVQDFGHALPTYSLAEVKDRISATVAQARRQTNQPAFVRRDLPTADAAACSMAQADTLGTSPVHQVAQRYTVLAYTSLRPETLPDNASQLFGSHVLRSFSVGACYARTETYPSGAYWVVLSLD